MTPRLITAVAPSIGLSKTPCLHQRANGNWPGGLEEVIIEAVDRTEGSRLRITSFAEAGLLSADEGLVLRFPGGVEFQLTIVRSR